MSLFAEVIKPGPLTTVQDLGRPDFTAVGVPIGGAMDPLALRAANRMLGNGDNDPALEVTLHRLELAITAAKIALCVGGAPRTRLNDQEIVPYEPFIVKRGDRLSLAPGSGARAYLACAGGIAIRKTLGSASTFLPASFGGFEGRALKAGDLLRAAKSPKKKPSNKLAGYLQKQDRTRLRFVGDAKLAATWTVDPRSDRMGVRLKGAPLAPTSGNLASQGAFHGLIQIPPDGSPILLGADAQTIGGYAIGGAITLADLWKIGQLLPGEPATLERISRREALKLWNEQKKFLA